MGKKEASSNVVLVCKGCAPKSTEAWKEVKPEFLIDCFVKKAFPAIDPSGKSSRESMWVLVTEARRGKLVGELRNIPAFEMELKLGDTVSVAMKEIIEVLGPTGAALKPKAIKNLEKLRR